MKSLLSAVAVSLTLIAAGECHASYSTTVTYDYGSASNHSPVSAGNGGLGSDYLTIVKPDASAFRDTFSLTGLAGITAATISITHNGNFDTVLPNGYGEQWQAVLNGTIPLGTLSNSFYDWTTGALITGWQTDTFTLNSAALMAINAASPSSQFTISFRDTTNGNNKFELANISVNATGDPVPTPLPAALSLFAPGLFGLAAFRRRLS